MAERGRAISALQRALFADIAEFDRAESWRGDGAVSMVAWLMQRCRVGRSTAAAWVRAAANLESLPHLAGALAEGALSLDAVAPLAEVATPQTDAELAKRRCTGVSGRSGSWPPRTVGPPTRRPPVGSNSELCASTMPRNTVWAAFTADDYAEAKAALTGRMSWGSDTGPTGQRWCAAHLRRWGSVGLRAVRSATVRRLHEPVSRRRHPRVVPGAEGDQPDTARRWSCMRSWGC